MKSAVNFEYEWMADGLLRVRFLDRDEAILGQQFIGPEGLLPLQILVALANARSTNLNPLLAAFRAAGIEASTCEVAALRDAVRVSVALTEEGGIDVETLDE